MEGVRRSPLSSSFADLIGESMAWRPIQITAIPYRARYLILPYQQPSRPPKRPAMDSPVKPGGDDK